MMPWWLAAMLAATGPAAAQDVAAGRAKAQICSVCHGTMGVAVHPEAPHLAGQPAAYLETQLRHYRNGQRQHPVMNVIAKPLSDSDIENLAAWFASIRVDAQGR